MERDPSLDGLPQQLPLFPLSDALLLPGGHLPLNIFEPRYLAMIDHALGARRLVGMIQPRHNDVINPPLYGIGCAGRIISFNETEDGRYMIALSGVCRFALKTEKLTDQGFRQGTADWSAFRADLDDDDNHPTAMRDRLLSTLGIYLDTVGLSADPASLTGADLDVLTTSISMNCPFEGEEKQALLEAPTLLDRVETLIALMEFGIAEGRLSDDPDTPQ